MRPLAFLRNSILPPLADSIEEEDQENEFENPNKKTSKVNIIENDENKNGNDSKANLDPKFMSFGENQSRNFDQPINDSYNEDHLSSFQPSQVEFASQIDYNDNDITLSRYQQNTKTDFSDQENQYSLSKR